MTAVVAPVRETPRALAKLKKAQASPSYLRQRREQLSQNADGPFAPLALLRIGGAQVQRVEGLLREGGRQCRPRGFSSLRTCVRTCAASAGAIISMISGLSSGTGAGAAAH